jgi:hypothetical protein
VPACTQVSKVQSSCVGVTLVLSQKTSTSRQYRTARICENTLAATDDARRMGPRSMAFTSPGNLRGGRSSLAPINFQLSFKFRAELVGQYKLGSELDYHASAGGASRVSGPRAQRDIEHCGKNSTDELESGARFMARPRPARGPGPRAEGRARARAAAAHGSAAIRASRLGQPVGSRCCLGSRP